MGLIHIGEGTYDAPTRRGNANTITIGKYCSIADGVIMDSGFNHRYDFVSTYPFNRLFSEVETNIELPKDILVGSDVWLAEGVVLMAGVTVSDGAVVGTNSVVTKGTYIGPYQVWAGAPAKFIKHRFDHLNLNKGDVHSHDAVRKLLKLKWWDKPIEEIRKIAPLLMSNDFEKLFKLYNL